MDEKPFFQEVPGGVPGGDVSPEIRRNLRGNPLGKSLENLAQGLGGCRAFGGPPISPLWPHCVGGPGTDRTDDYDEQGQARERERGSEGERARGREGARERGGVVG